MNILIAATSILLLSAIIAQESDVERRFACWESVGPPVVSAQCHKNTVLHVIRAGLKVQSNSGQCEFNDADCGCTSDQPGCQMPDVAHLCMGKPSCRLDVTQQYIDTGLCQGFSDYMFIEYKCVEDERETSQDICTTMTQEHPSGFLQTPNYPHTYPNNQHCECTLQVTTDTTIDLKVLDLRLADESCKHDEVTLQYNEQLTKLCGQSNGMQEVIPTKAHQVKVIFDSDQEGGDNGFWIKYEANGPVKVSCKSIYKPMTDDKAEMLSPEVPIISDKEEKAIHDIQVNSDDSNTFTTDTLNNFEGNINVDLTPNGQTIQNDVTEQVENDDDYPEYIETSTMDPNLARTISFDENQEGMENIHQAFESIYENIETNTLVPNEVNTISIEEDIQDTENFNPNIILENEIEKSTETNIIEEATDENEKTDKEITEHNRIINIQSEFNNAIREERQEEKQLITEVNPMDVIQQTRFRRPQRNNNNYNNRYVLSNNQNRRRPDTDQINRNLIRLEQRRNRQRINNQNTDQNQRHSNRNNFRDGRGQPYDRISFEKDMFEDYASQIDPPSDMNTTPERIPIRRRNQQHINSNVYRQQQVQQVPRFRNQNPSSRGMYNQNIRDSTPPRLREQTNRRGKLTNTDQNKSKKTVPPSAFPWWWKFTAKKHTSITPTKFPSKLKLNENMKDNYIEQDIQNDVSRQSIVNNSEKQASDDSVQVPSDDNADSFMDSGAAESVQTGLLEGSKQTEDESNTASAEATNSTTVTVVAVAVIAMIIIIVIVGIVVRWVLNKREQKRVMRHRHKKECAMRQQHLRQSSSQPRNMR